MPDFLGSWALDLERHHERVAKLMLWLFRTGGAWLSLVLYLVLWAVVLPDLKPWQAVLFGFGGAASLICALVQFPALRHFVRCRKEECVDLQEKFHVYWVAFNGEHPDTLKDVKAALAKLSAGLDGF